MKCNPRHILGGLAVGLAAILIGWSFWIASSKTRDHAAAARDVPPTAEASPAMVPAAFQPQNAVQAYNLARQYQSRQDLDNAIFNYQLAIAHDSGMANAWFNLGQCYAAKNDNTSARDAYEHAVKVQPDFSGARYNLALTLLNEHKRDGALAQLREIVRLQPDNAAAYYVLGYALADDPQTAEQAKQAYNRFLKLAPHDPNVPSVRDWLSRH